MTESAAQPTYCCAICEGPISVADNLNGGIVTVNVNGHGRAAHRECPGGVYVSDPDAFTEPWYQRRAAAYAKDARKLIEMVREYEDVHPDDAPCLESLLRATTGISWRGHPADSAGGTDEMATQ